MTLTAIVGLVSLDGTVRAAQDVEEPGAAPAAVEPAPITPSRAGYLVTVTLPITPDSAQQLRQSIVRFADAAPQADQASQRPVLVLEFDTSFGRTGQGSELESCWSIARLLTSPRLAHLHTIAYIPAPRGLPPDAQLDDARPQSQLMGHAVLVALACEEIAMHQDAMLGRAGIDETEIAPAEREIYREVANQRRSLPSAVAMSLLDPDVALHRVQTADGARFVDQAELAELEASGAVISSETIAEAGSLPLLSSQQLAASQLIRLRVTSRGDLAARLEVAPHVFEGDPSLGQAWNAVQLNLEGVIEARSAGWLLRALNSRLDSGDVNLVIVYIDSPGGHWNECVRLAKFLADLDPQQVRTVAFVPREARGASALVALACDQLLMSQSATLGGGDDLIGQETQPADVRAVARTVAQSNDRDWSPIAGLVDTTLDVERWHNVTTGQQRLLADEERHALVDADDWQSLGKVDLRKGVSGTLAEQWQLARALVADASQLRAFYQLSAEPEVVQPTGVDRVLEKFARFLASPWVAAWLLFGAMFLLSTELSHPGVGVAGFLGTLCLILFFWSQYLDGNTHWLEILLFLAGIGFVLLELFILPGFGVFGFGGLLMIVVSLVLATQTFILPRTSEELHRMPVSLGMAVAAFGGGLVAMLLLRRYLARAPFLNRLMLRPPAQTSTKVPTSDVGEGELYASLLGQQGTAATPLMPAGKANIAGRTVDVISDGAMVERGSAIVVVEVQGNRIVVKPADDSAAPPQA